MYRQCLVLLLAVAHTATAAAQLERVFDSTYAVAHLRTTLGRALRQSDTPVMARAYYALGMAHLEAPNSRSEGFGHLFKSSQLFLATKDTVGYYRAAAKLAALYYEDIQAMERERLDRDTEQAKQRDRFVILLVIFFVVVAASIVTMIVYNQRYLDQQTIAEQSEEINRQKIKALEHSLRTETLHAMLTGQEAERQRVSKDLHDGLGGLLASIKHRIEGLPPSGDPKRGNEVAQLRDLIDEACDEVRNVTFNLQPYGVEKFGLLTAVGDLLERLKGQQDMQITFQQWQVPVLPGGEFATHSFRIVQELVANALKHAQAKHLLVQFSGMPGELAILVEDDGKGFDPAQEVPGNGLKNIRSRVSYLKGHIEWDSEVGKGTSVLVHLPISMGDKQ